MDKYESLVVVDTVLDKSSMCLVPTKIRVISWGTYGWRKQRWNKKSNASDTSNNNNYNKKVSGAWNYNILSGFRLDDWAYLGLRYIVFPVLRGSRRSTLCSNRNAHQVVDGILPEPLQKLHEPLGRRVSWKVWSECWKRGRLGFKGLIYKKTVFVL